MYNDEIYSKGVDGKDLCIYKNGNVEQVESGSVYKGREADGVDDPAYQNAVEVAEMGRYHDHGSFLGQATQHFHLAYDVNLVAEAIPVAENGAELLYPGAVEEADKPEFDNLPGEAIRTRIKSSCNFFGIPEHNLVQQVFFLFGSFLGGLAAQLNEVILYARPEAGIVLGVYPPAVALDAILLPKHRGFQLLQQLLPGGAEQPDLFHRLLGNFFEELFAVLAELVNRPVRNPIENGLVPYVLILFFF